MGAIGLAAALAAVKKKTNGKADGSEKQESDEDLFSIAANKAYESAKSGDAKAFSKALKAAVKIASYRDDEEDDD